MPEAQLERHPGSFSVLSREPRYTAAKIVIYPDRLEWTKDWPRMSEGVYAWVRTNGPVGKAIWDDILRVELSHMFARMDRNDTVQIAANPQADFAYFPVMAGEDYQELARFLAPCAQTTLAEP